MSTSAQLPIPDSFPPTLILEVQYYEPLLVVLNGDSTYRYESELSGVDPYASYGYCIFDKYKHEETNFDVSSFIRWNEVKRYAKILNKDRYNYEREIIEYSGVRAIYKHAGPL